MNEQIDERLLDLLCKQAVHGLTNEELKELQAVEQTVESSVDLNSLEMTAAAIAMSAVPASDTLPDHLKAGILAKADEYFAVQNEGNSSVVTTVREAGKPSIAIWGWLGWATAAAALIFLALIFTKLEQWTGQTFLRPRYHKSRPLERCVNSFLPVLPI